MKDINDSAFIALFKEACKKGFGFPITSPLSETDSRLLSNKIFDETGLVIGVKSIKNYSIYVINHEGKENPSVATLDTLARYVLNAPPTDEVHRKKNESHHPYWFQFRSSYSTSLPASNTETTRRPFLLTPRRMILLAAVIIAGVIFALIRFTSPGDDKNFVEEFNTVNEDSLSAHGWMVQSIDSMPWSKRGGRAGHLTLFTLKGDNWPGFQHPAGIRNLLVKEVADKCFATEVHFSNFLPRHNWQQAGILIAENSQFTGKVIRLSISYNDFFGGFEKSPEILVQGLSSTESGVAGKPEEFSHFTIFDLPPGDESLVEDNLGRSGLKIEKKGNHFRFLLTSGAESFAFKEIASGDFSLKPTHVGIFAIQGFADSTHVMGVAFDSFRIIPIDCSQD